MPIYEYRCESCGHELEALQKMSDSPLVGCPECSAQQLIKKVSAAAFRLKGSGWYETDFKSGKKKNLAGSDKEPSKTAAKKADKPSSKSA
ncbi:FmdB family zinc ribbon protein [Teredinibacter purpureus]|jgi:putative regulatory protein, FmdB family|uniref:FmdB family zinc ribbon protein n=1 Tax=Teredinibacter purpureus TaxID=2731756 RepID=UPI0005F8566F|nr:zinc ribbon domain-containing protein [Teredinibacter purpureus]